MKLVLHHGRREKTAKAFFRISRSSFTCASSLRSLSVSALSAEAGLTFPGGVGLFGPAPAKSAVSSVAERSRPHPDHVKLGDSLSSLGYQADRILLELVVEMSSDLFPLPWFGHLLYTI